MVGNLEKKDRYLSSYQEQHVINLENITLSKRLGKGEFGSVYQAAWNNSNSTEQIQVFGVMALLVLKSYEEQ